MIVQARGKYLYAGRSMRAYEDSKYFVWRDHAESVVATLLKRNLLVRASSVTSSVFSDRQYFDKVSQGGVEPFCYLNTGEWTIATTCDLSMVYLTRLGRFFR